MRNVLLVLIVSTGLFLGACGGGGGVGGGSMVEPKPPVTQPPEKQPDTPLFQPGALQTSYELQHSVVHVDGRSLPVPRTRGYGWTGVAAYGDFDGDGDEDVIHAPLDGTANPSPLEMYLNDGNGEYRLDNRLFGSDVPGLVHPRKLLTGDFNGDGRLDVFVAGHGHDQPPYPGEAPLLLLSSAQGLRKKEGFDHIIGFHHGAASADVDHDGDLDIFVTSQWDDSFFLKNDGYGNFVHDTSAVPPGLKGQSGLQFYTTEIVDVDDDGYPELIAAGHEGPGEAGRQATTIYWGNGSGAYDDSRKTILPWVPGYEVVIDIDVGDLDGDGIRDVVLNRTSLDPFYQGYFIQIVSGRDGRRFTDETLSRMRGGNDPDAKWILWLRLEDIDKDGDLDIVSDGPRPTMLSWVNNGSGTLSGPSEPDRTALAAPQRPLTHAEIREQLNTLYQDSNIARQLSVAASSAASVGYDVVSSEASSVAPDKIDWTPYQQKSSRNGVALALGRQPQEGSPDVLQFAGWMDHSFFLLTMHDIQGRFHAGVYAVGNAPGTNPASGGATWKGVMVGADGSRAARGHVLRGDAEIVIADFLDPKASVAFTNIYDLDVAERRDDMTWGDLPVADGGFGRCASLDCIEGTFYGIEHQEVGGIFVRDNIAGAFGATRQ